MADREETTFELSLLPPNQSIRIQGTRGQHINDVLYSATISWAKYPASQERETLEYSFQNTDGFQGGAQAKSIHQVAVALEQIRDYLKNNF